MKQPKLFTPLSVREVNKLNGKERAAYFAKLITYFRKQK